MKREISLVFLAVFSMTLVLAVVSYPKIVATLDPDNDVVFILLDRETGERLGVPLVENLGGIATCEIKEAHDDFMLRIVLLNKETKEEVRAWTKGPFGFGEDLVLDLTNGEFRILEDEEVQEIEVADLDQPLIENEDAGITGNVVGSSGFSLRSISSTVLLVGVLALALFLIVNHRNKKLMASMPEEKELKQLEKQAKSKGKAISKIKEEQKLKAKIESQKRRAAMRIAKEDAELSQLNKEGSSARAREAEQFDKKKGAGGFY